MPFFTKTGTSFRTRFSRASILSRATNLFHRGAPWIFGPVLVGLVGVMFAIQSDYASKANGLLSSSCHHMLPPLMVAVALATVAARLICPVPIYEALAERFMPLPEADARETAQSEKKSSRN